jgi:hypothetical protein
MEKTLFKDLTFNLSCPSHPEKQAGKRDKGYFSLNGSANASGLVINLSHPLTTDRE